MSASYDDYCIKYWLVIEASSTLLTGLCLLPVGLHLPTESCSPHPVHWHHVVLQHILASKPCIIHVTVNGNHRNIYIYVYWSSNSLFTHIILRSMNVMQVRSMNLNSLSEDLSKNLDKLVHRYLRYKRSTSRVVLQCENEGASSASSWGRREDTEDTGSEEVVRGCPRGRSGVPREAGARPRMWRWRGSLDTAGEHLMSLWQRKSWAEDPDSPDGRGELAAASMWSGYHTSYTCDTERESLTVVIVRNEMKIVLEMRWS